MNIFKRKPFVKVIYTGLTEKGDKLSKGGVRIENRAEPDLAMSMMLGALQDIAERFRNGHNRMPIPCDCLAIRYANLIVHHTEVIHNEMSKVKLKK